MMRWLVIVGAFYVPLLATPAVAQCSCAPGSNGYSLQAPIELRLSNDFDGADGSALMAGVHYWNEYWIDNDINIELSVVGPDFMGPVAWEIVADSNVSSGAITDHGNRTIRISTTHMNQGLSSLMYFIGRHEFGHVAGFANRNDCTATETIMAGSVSASGPFTGSVTCSDAAAMRSKYPTRLSPIIIDLDHDNVVISDLTDGILFDIMARGVLDHVAWPVSGRDAFLVMDRNGNGLIDSGAELFGNRTSLVSGGTAEHGYQALAELDENGDGLVDASDSAFSRLAVWQDNNRDGVSAPSELWTLPSLDVTSLEVHPKEARRKDRWGNLFQYRARAIIGGRAHFTYDVFLLYAAVTGRFQGGGEPCVGK
ncbi:MAG: hypothetical protein M3505_07145 [Verrucomicrobiota bacterium]|nr:hypothetical protein [Verrucomicrobiota bacterium]